MTWLILLPLALWFLYKIARAWPAILASAKAQADAMEDMDMANAARYAFLGRVETHADD